MEDEVQRLVKLVNEAHNVDDPTSLRLVAKRISQMPDEVIELIERLRTEKYVNKFKLWSSYRTLQYEDVISMKIYRYSYKLNTLILIASISIQY